MMLLRQLGLVKAASATLLAIVPFCAAAACDLASAPNSRWSLVEENGVDWFKTPCGERFFSLGVNTLDGGYSWRTQGNKIAYNWQTFYPSLGSIPPAAGR
jgi:hypothetical protein